MNLARAIHTRNFEISEAAPSEDACGGVLAANRAAAQLLDQLATWASALATERYPEGR